MVKLRRTESDVRIDCDKHIDSDLIQLPAHLIVRIFSFCWEPNMLLVCKGIAPLIDEPWAQRVLKRTPNEVWERDMKMSR